MSNDYSGDDWDNDSDENDSTVTSIAKNNDAIKCHRNDDVSKSAACAAREIREDIAIDTTKVHKQMNRDKKWSTPKYRSGIIKSRATFDDTPPAIPPALPESEETTVPVDIAAQRLPLANIAITRIGSVQLGKNRLKNQTSHETSQVPGRDVERAPQLPFAGPRSKIHHGGKTHDKLAAASHITIVGHSGCKNFQQAMKVATGVPGIHVNMVKKSHQVGISGA